MALDHTYPRRILAESERIKETITRTYQAIATARELLSEASPSAFPGRKTQEPFPQEKRSFLPGRAGGQDNASQVSGA